MVGFLSLMQPGHVTISSFCTCVLQTFTLDDCCGLTGVGRPNTAAVPKALVVDHCLRPNSAAEAEQALQTACSLGLDAVLLKVEWPRSRPSQGQLMTQSREERYHLMSAACATLGIPCLLTGHHAGARHVPTAKFFSTDIAHSHRPFST